MAAQPRLVHLSAVFLLTGTGVTFFVGALPGASLGSEEACHRAGQTCDLGHRTANIQEYGRWFPLHDKCHAGYGLVPPG
ncbi:hypothetical protein V1J52_19445 [Streptomyces sp. TRM 70351]|uniref:hypothetical protein n=1 Tax=Streptomyces sp. TRM 70351 TaxID=3116552 RepID=UPI002E7B305E|nr:hypothetical protein [Streptomyces sp. TRM 70351]MEE1930330.1 hypothetical protein [Streptomyces sp. TRM 70351]